MCDSLVLERESFGNMRESKSIRVEITVNRELKNISCILVICIYSMSNEMRCYRSYALSNWETT